MRKMPATLDAALSLAVQQQSVEIAQQCLFKQIHRGDAVAMALQQRGEEETEAASTQCRVSELAELSILDLMKSQRVAPPLFRVSSTSE